MRFNGHVYANLVSESTRGQIWSELAARSTSMNDSRFDVVV